MSLLAVVVLAVYGAGLLVCFYAFARHLERYFMAERGPCTSVGEARFCAFASAVGCALVWPPVVLFALAIQPSRAEKREAERRRTLEAIQQSERALGIGSGE